MTRHPAVLFDFDYTLADSSPGVIESVNWALSDLGIPPRADDDIRRTIGLSLAETFAALVAPDDRREGASAQFPDLFIRRADVVMAGATTLLPGAREAVLDLERRGVTMGVVSTKFRRRIELVLDREDFRGPFSVIIGGEDVPAHKPDPACLLAACAALDTPPSACMYVGDSAVDGEAASRASMPFVGVLSGMTPATVLAAWKPLTVLADVRQLPGWMEENVDG